MPTQENHLATRRGGRSLHRHGTIPPRAERLGRQRTCRQGSGLASLARKTPGIWPARRSSWATSPSPGCGRWRSCAAPSPTPASGPSLSPSATRAGCSPPGTWKACARSGPSRACPRTSLPTIHRSPAARCALPASAWRSASPRPGPRPRMSPRRWCLTSKRCPRSSTASPRAGPAHPECTTSGTTISS